MLLQFVKIGIFVIIIIIIGVLEQIRDILFISSRHFGLEVRYVDAQVYQVTCAVTHDLVGGGEGGGRKERTDP